MANVRGIISVSNVSLPVAIFFAILNLVGGAALVCAIGFLLHIGWNWV